ncbi:amino acid ABC transporter, substrate-binding protein [Lactobacillus kimbladii]|uniref:Amino acid ABC transporter, substrate-binding protein n=2 Tax=Lactobacillus TaxID=1578 RepID=A0A0F4L9K5_9LACO|nr:MULTISPECIES: amino acid ABC transporter substrate-binding protein [Lactobacillus]KJY54055.1 amino acid ABC transporter, substrate binding protein [Lactobacillus kullabergensis]KJY54924.1 amino acid ABC transporter, substrate-binding protein [Lactobacillus kimbladii]MBC6370361.1 amino acid ABC transporter substrate-binding protein [Lactobacillus kullabergensis]
MKTKRLLTLIITLICTLFISACSGISVNRKANAVDNWSHIKQRGYVTVGVDDTFVPMDFRQKNGQLIGYDVDLANAVFKQYGINVSFQTIDWSMNTTELKNGTIDLIWNGFSKNPEREAKVSFSKTYLYTSQVLVSLKKNKINTIAAMKNKTLGVQTGSSGYNDVMKYPKVFKNHIKNQDPILYDSFTNAFIDLNAGRIQGLLIDSTYANYYISRQKHPENFTEIESPFPKEEFGVGMRKSDLTLHKKINYALEKLAKNGTLTKINHKWFGNKAESPLLQTKKD